jgi:glutamate/tyrosine decarboxylase-like PLP-dependent enzyme
MKTKPTFCCNCNCGTTNAGIIDDLDGIANLCEEKGLWFHIDAVMVVVLWLCQK